MGIQFVTKSELVKSTQLLSEPAGFRTQNLCDHVEERRSALLELRINKNFASERLTNIGVLDHEHSVLCSHGRTGILETTCV
jgi:hypothetical protein